MSGFLQDSVQHFPSYYSIYTDRDCIEELNLAAKALSLSPTEPD